jgi:stress-induced-phosphoprotein 1|tara:strand:- start:204 stop:572 length:369 start_codon:yes stop_codon:yes gene_type:complete
LFYNKDPENEELKDGYRRTVLEIQKGQTGQVDEEEMKQRQSRAMQDPDIQNILQDPVMRQVLNDMSNDPKAAAEHQKNAMIMVSTSQSPHSTSLIAHTRLTLSFLSQAKIQKLINAGIVQTR